MRTPSFDDIEDAARQIDGVAVKTPLIRNDALDEALRGKVFVKAEVLQRTGSFKFRGAYNRISRLNAEERRAGVVAYSSGNHAQAVARAAGLVGAPAVIVMPADAPAMKIDNTRALGAEVVLYDRATESREDIAGAILSRRGATLVPPFEDPFIIAGQGTASLEAAAQLECHGARADVLLCPASGGGLMAGTALSMEALSPATELYAVEPFGFDDTARSLASGKREKNAAQSGSLCDALLTPEPGALTFSINQPRLKAALDVTDEEALTAVGFAFRHLKLVIEPGGAVGLAALLAGKVALHGRTALVIASGGNIDPAVFARAIAA